MLKPILIRSIPHKKHRYETVGDYYTLKNGKTVVHVSDMHNWKYEFLCAIHELVVDCWIQE